MVRSSVKTITYSSGSRKYARSRQLVAKAAQLVRARMAGSTRAPIRTGGFYGLYNRRGREELKVIDTTLTTTNVGTGGTFFLLNGINQGSDYTQRIGRKVILKSLLLRATCLPNTSSSTPAGDVIRFLVVYDCQTNSATPAIGDVLQNSSINDPMNLNNRDRFKIVADKFVTLNACTYVATALTVGAPQTKQVKLYKKMNLEMIFSGTGATVGSIGTGALFLILISGFNGQSTALWTARVRYTDS